MIRYLMKVPALNVTHVCGTVTTTPTTLHAAKTANAIFELSARTYERGRKNISVRIKVVCWGAIAEAVIAKVRQGDVVLVNGSLQNHKDQESLSLVAAVVQFLTVDTTASTQSE